MRPGASVLDLCCGTGRHSLQLARLGFSVTAVDRTKTYLDEARTRAEVEKLEIQFVHEEQLAASNGEKAGRVHQKSISLYSNDNSSSNETSSHYSTHRTMLFLLVKLWGKLLPRVAVLPEQQKVFPIGRCLAGRSRHQRHTAGSQRPADRTTWFR